MTPKSLATEMKGMIIAMPRVSMIDIKMENINRYKRNFLSCLDNKENNLVKNGFIFTSPF